MFLFFRTICVQVNKPEVVGYEVHTKYILRSICLCCWCFGTSVRLWQVAFSSDVFLPHELKMNAKTGIQTLAGLGRTCGTEETICNGLGVRWAGVLVAFSKVAVFGGWGGKTRAGVGLATSRTPREVAAEWRLSSSSGLSLSLSLHFEIDEHCPDEL